MEETVKTWKVIPSYTDSRASIVLAREATQFGWEIKKPFALDTVENRW
jgi:hypothetical protein